MATSRMEVRSGLGRTVTFDGEVIIIRTGRGRADEIVIPVSHDISIDFCGNLTGGYIEFLSPSVRAHIEFTCRKRSEFKLLKAAVEHAARRARVPSVATTRRKDVDPAALLIAVIVVAVAPLFENGLWDKLNTIVGVIVLVIVIAYSATRPVRLSMGNLERVAVSLAIGLICSVAVAWPIQQFYLLPRWQGQHPGQALGRAGESLADNATLYGLKVGLFIAILLWILGWAEKRRRS
jgi:hypothetical protein